MNTKPYWANPEQSGIIVDVAGRDTYVTGGDLFDAAVAEGVNDFAPIHVIVDPNDPLSDPAAFALSDWRATAYCSKMQGILTLGETKWNEVLTYRETATWAEKMIIDSATDWHRNSQNTQFIGYLVGYTDAEMDSLFIIAQDITV